MSDVDARSSEQPSDRMVAQRVRNRVIEYLELAASFQAQQQYERDVPIAHVPYEVINQWKDWVWKDPRDDPNIPDVYDGAEVEALGRFQAAWEATVDAVPDDYPSLSQVQALPEWQHLRRAADSALDVFMRRGKMPEDHEVG